MSDNLAFGPFILDRQRGRLLREGRPIAVSSKGLQLLGALLDSPGRVLTKTELMQAAWGDAAVEESNLSVQIAAEAASRLTSIPGIGLGQWLRGLLARAHSNAVVVALAAKLARIVWALLRHGTTFEQRAIAI